MSLLQKVNFGSGIKLNFLLSRLDVQNFQATDMLHWPGNAIGEFLHSLALPELSKALCTDSPQDPQPEGQSSAMSVLQ
jgi:hypothetical protein